MICQEEESPFTLGSRLQQGTRWKGNKNDPGKYEDHLLRYALEQAAVIDILAVGMSAQDYFNLSSLASKSGGALIARKGSFP